MTRNLARLLSSELGRSQRPSMEDNAAVVRPRCLHTCSEGCSPRLYGETGCCQERGFNPHDLISRSLELCLSSEHDTLALGGNTGLSLRRKDNESRCRTLREYRGT